MLSVPVYNESGEQVATEQIDEAALGRTVNHRLLKQAAVMYHSNRRQGHAVQKTRAEVDGARRKIYRQKGSGRARMGNRRTCVRRGGGRAFAKKVREYRQMMPRKMRRLACHHAVLAKIQSEDALILDGLEFEEPKTKRFAAVLQAVNCERGCLFATNGVDRTLYKSARNIPRAEIMDVAQLNAFDILSRRKLVFTREAFATFRHGAAAAPEKAGA
jgi:large subunit ribosomal protein L4